MSEKVCPIDSSVMTHLFTAKVLSRHDVDYFQCPECRLLQTESPYWLDEAYQQAYNGTDTGLATRSFLNRLRLEPVLQLLFKCRGSFLDIGGGYGLFARLMRDIGISFYTTDKYCENLFAQGFEPTSEFKASALTSFEVFEHLPDPKSFLEENFERYQCKTIIFTTESFSCSPPETTWPYYGFCHGQHITFYHPDSLSRLAVSLGCHYTHLFSDLHLITDRALRIREKFILTNKPLFLLLALLTRISRRKKSFTQLDSIQANS